MKLLRTLAFVLFAATLGACKTPPPPSPGEVTMYPAVVGEKTDLYEVTSPTSVRLAPGTKLKIVDGPGGTQCGMIMLRPNGSTGGYMACGCIGATTSSCITTNDNPDHPSCSGNCTDSEGKALGCMLFGPIIGPPRDPSMVKFRARK